VLLDQIGFRHIRSVPWTFIPKGDMPALVASLLTVLDAIGRYARLDSLRGGLALCAWKEAKDPLATRGDRLPSAFELPATQRLKVMNDANKS
jgi:hypothetical protein